MTKSNEQDPRYTATAESCPDWCNVDHAGLEPDAGVDLTYHSGLLAEGVHTGSHGPLYRAELVTDDEGACLWVDVESDTMTAAQAEVLGRALIKGAQILRARPDARPAVRLTSYWNGGRLISTAPAVFEQTAAEREVSAQQADTA